MKIIEGFEWLWGALGVASGYIVRFVFDRKKLNAENKSAELDADSKAVELYERFASQLNPKIESLQLKIEQLTDQVFTLREENANLKSENSNLKSENNKLKIDVDKMHQEILLMQQKIK